ncbi:MAG: thioredoxin domain-containing protein [Polyangiaceae bacterium]
MRVVAHATLLLIALLGGCAPGPGMQPHTDFAEDSPRLPGAGSEALPPPTSPPEELPGVGTAELDEREKLVWWKLVNQLYAPCPDQAVSIAQCVKDKRSCPSCAPAADLLASRVKLGATPSDAEAAYAARFGPNPKRVDVGTSPSRGPERAPVTMVVWSDFQCPACGRAVPFLDELPRKLPEELRLVHKFYPLNKHPMAEGAARAAVAAQNQGRYWEMEHLLFANQEALSQTDLEGYAQKLGLDMDRFRADMRSDKAKEIIERDKAEADRAGLRYTPFILINGREFDTAWFRVDEDLEPWIRLEAKLVKAAALQPPTVSAPPASLSPAK